MPGGLVPVVILPAFIAARTGAGLAGRSAWPTCCHPAQCSAGRQPAAALEVRLDAVAAVVLDGLSYRRAGRVVGISKTEVDMTAWTCCLPSWPPSGTASPTGRSSPPLRSLASGLGRDGPLRRGGVRGRARHPGPTTQVMGQPEGLYDAKRHAHTAQGLAVSTIWGDLLWCDGGWPGSCHEHELRRAVGAWRGAGRRQRGQPADRGFRGLAKGRERWHAPVGDRRTKDRLSEGQRAFNRLQAGCARWWSSRSPSCQRLAAAPLAGPAVPGPGRLPGRWRAHLLYWWLHRVPT